MQPITRAFLLTLPLVLASGCGPRDRVSYVESSDADMNAAIQQARETVPTSIAALHSASRNQTSFGVKKPFPVGKGGAEHIWLTEVALDGQVFRGVVGNDPVDVKRLKFGDPATVATNEISDWMFVEDGRSVGGYTIRVLSDFKTEKGRRRFERETGLKP
jgi:uncharacterized protein YegJ (DUF2314 family)